MDEKDKTAHEFHPVGPMPADRKKEIEDLKQNGMKSIWFPEMNQLVPMRNPNYLQSVWVGFFWAVVHLPFMLWGMLIKPVLVTSWRLICMLFVTLWLGFTGRLTALNIPRGMVCINVGDRQDES